MLKEDIQQADDLIAEKSIIEKSQLDPAFFKPLYEKYFKNIFLFVHRRVGDKELAADLTSQIFLKALLNIKKYQIRGLPFSAWLYRIAINECATFFRRHKRERLVSLDQQSVRDLFDDMTSAHSPDELQNRLPMILGHLAADDLQIIELRYFEQRTFKEVADILGISETYAKVRVYRILEKMRKMFVRYQSKTDKA